jgi:hypothetical protein
MLHESRNIETHLLKNSASYGDFMPAILAPREAENRKIRSQD